MISPKKSLAIVVHNRYAVRHDCRAEVLVEIGLQFLPSGHRG